MSKPALVNTSALTLDQGYVLRIAADGKQLSIIVDDHTFRLYREEALLLVEAITARLAEVTEGQ